jgi:LydA holin phage, holin superfamily III
MDQEPNYIFIKIVLFSAFAAFGGFVRYLFSSIEKGTTISFAAALIETCAAGFVGALMAMACAALKIDEMWIGVISGVSGWLGATATIGMLKNIISPILGLKDDKDVSKN